MKYNAADYYDKPRTKIDKPIISNKLGLLLWGVLYGGFVGFFIGWLVGGL